jgi:hypothetical protein
MVAEQFINNDPLSMVAKDIMTEFHIEYSVLEHTLVQRDLQTVKDK